jgi:hypothetical protein
MIILDCEQSSEEWRAAKRGVVSSTGFKKIITTKGKKSEMSHEYMLKLLSESITGEYDNYENEWMKRGKELEPQAREMWEFVTGKTTEQVGFVYLDSNKMIGCSPDGINSGLEIKCPAAHTHMSYLLNNKLPTEYFQQVQGCMWITGSTEWNFMSYHPKMKPLILTIKRDYVFTEKLEKLLTEFTSDLIKARIKYNLL